MDHLLRLPRATIGKYWEEAHDSGGVLTPARSRGRAKKSAGDLASKGYKPEDWSIYDLIKWRTSAAHESGKANGARNLLRWATEDEGGPILPRASERLAREILARLGIGYKKRMNLIVASRGNPYVSRWRGPIDGKGRREYLAKKSPGRESSWMPPLLTKIPPGKYMVAHRGRRRGYCRGP